jgi:hypothetical protein
MKKELVLISKRMKAFTEEKIKVFFGLWKVWHFMKLKLRISRASERICLRKLRIGCLLFGLTRDALIFIKTALPNRAFVKIARGLVNLSLYSNDNFFFNLAITLTYCLS